MCIHLNFRMKVNLPKNRYTDVLCYDHSRVDLPVIDNEDGTNYINANFVDGYMQKNAFISTQGTYKPMPLYSPSLNLMKTSG